MGKLASVLEDSSRVKIMHDARQDAELLQRQFGIQLRGVLDTQLLHGLSRFAHAACPDTHACTELSQAAGTTPTGSSLNRAVDTAAEVQEPQPPDRRLGRVGLDALYTKYGFQHGNKKAVQMLLTQDCRLWRQRPLTGKLTQYAAADVRYLIPLAARLLQEQQQAMVALSTVQAAMGSASSSSSSNGSLQLQPEQTGGCSSLLQLHGSDAQLLQFEMTLGHGHVPRFDVCKGGSSGDGIRRIVSDDGSGISRTMAGSEEAGSVGALAAEDGQQADAAQESSLDEAVCSMLELLPPRLAELLGEYRSASKVPPLLEVTLDQGGSIGLTFTDDSPQQHLQLDVSISEALQRLMDAKQGAMEPANSDAAVEFEGGQDVRRRGLLRIFSGGSDVSDAVLPITSYPDPFSSDNRMGVPGQLHRISGIRNRGGRVIGLTYRIGRHMPGVGHLILDQLAAMKRAIANGDPRSVLLLGRPGVGKTTLLRDIARLMSTHPDKGGLGLRVVVIDTSNEIAGDGDAKHSCIGTARRMMVQERHMQHKVMLEAVQNHTPQVIIVDEIGTREEVAAAKTISQKGVLLVATAHGTSIHTILKDNVLRGLVGDVRDVTLGDDLAQKTNTGKKSRLERAGAATFTSLLELQSRNTWRLHPDVEESVDLLLRQQQPHTQLRSYDAQQRMFVQFETAVAAERALGPAPAGRAGALPGTYVAARRDAGVLAAADGGVGSAQKRFSGSWLLDVMHAGAQRAMANGY